jgi:hypothetical protein
VAEGARAAFADAVVEPGLVRLDAAGFARAASISIDYAVMERTDKAARRARRLRLVGPGRLGRHLGRLAAGRAGNAAQGDVTLVDTTGVLARSTGPFVGVIGVSDLMIVAEPDAVLVCRRDDAQAVKALVDGLKAKGRDLAATPSDHVSGGGVERRPVADTDHASRRAVAVRHGRNRRCCRPAASRCWTASWRAGGRLEGRRSPGAGRRGRDGGHRRRRVTLLVTTWR